MPATPAITISSSVNRPSATLKPANSMIASLEVGMQALSSSIRMKIPAVPRSPITFVAKSTIGWVSEAVTRAAKGAVLVWQGSVTVVRIPLFDTEEQLRELRPRARAPHRGVVDSGRFILGPEVEAFEREFADYLGV